jgi:hypothetical protein
MLSFLLLATLAQAAPFAPVIGPARAKLQGGGTIAEVLERVSAPLVGKPYELGPLGEGDKLPLYRLDAFDCTTFVETVMANAYCYPAGKADCLEAEMERIRYRGKAPSFRDRNHVPELDWLPNNVRRGFLKDLSDSLFPGEWRIAIPKFDRAAWLITKGESKPGAIPKPVPLHYIAVTYFFTKKIFTAQEEKALAAKLGESGEEAAAETEKDEAARIKFRGELAYLRAAYVPIEERLQQIPPGTVLNLVHAPSKDPAKAKLTPLVTHQGLIVRGKEGLRIRHAAPNVGHVSDQPLADYLLRYVRSANYRGISLFEVLGPQKLVGP